MLYSAYEKYTKAEAILLKTLYGRVRVHAPFKLYVVKSAVFATVQERSCFKNGQSSSGISTTHDIYCNRSQNKLFTLVVRKQKIEAGKKCI